MRYPSKKTKLIHIICSSGFYGAERVVANLCHALPDIDTCVLCLTSNTKQITTFSKKVISANTEFFTLPNSIINTLRVLQDKRKPNSGLILHAHGYKEIVIACMFSWLFPCRVVVTQHGFTERNLKSKLYNWIGKVFCRWGGVERVIAVSQQIKSVYQKFSVKEQKIQFIPNGILPKNSSNKDKMKPRYLKQWNKNEKSVFIGYAGRLSEEKDPLLFIEIIADIAQHRPNVIGVIAGNGPLRETVQEAIDHYQLQNHIMLLGFVENIEQLLPTFDILLLTSKTEGMPMIVLEAMIANTVVVCPEIGSLPSIIDNGINGILVAERTAMAFSNAIQELLHENGKLDAVAQAGKNTIDRNYNLLNQRSLYLKSIYSLEPAS